MNDKVAELIVRLFAIHQELEKLGPQYSKCADQIAEVADKIEEVSNELV